MSIVLDIDTSYVISADISLQDIRTGEVHYVHHIHVGYYVATMLGLDHSYISSYNHILLIPHGVTLTYVHCYLRRYYLYLIIVH